MKDFEELKKALMDAFGESKLSNMLHALEECINLDNEIPCGLTMVANLDAENYDSYGNEDTTLRKILKADETFGNIYVEMSGTRRSYSGTEWDTFKLVTPRLQTITIYE